MFYARRRDRVLAHCIAARLPVGEPDSAARGFGLTGHAGLDSQPCAAVALCRSATVFS